MPDESCSYLITFLTFLCFWLCSWSVPPVHQIHIMSCTWKKSPLRWQRWFSCDNTPCVTVAINRFAGMQTTADGRETVTGVLVHWAVGCSLLLIESWSKLCIMQFFELLLIGMSVERKQRKFCFLRRSHVSIKLQVNSKDFYHFAAT